MQNYTLKHAIVFKWFYLEADKGMYGQTLLFSQRQPCEISLLQICFLTYSLFSFA